jgi:alkanesulfonate monooxygenase SsuD/methylene tetrahydromethanopterin reductase-like flavin-dependent oxidoreductase (luciferase family)
MLILFDHSNPAPLSSFLTGHTVTTARDRGWDRLSNGDLLTAADAAGFDVLLTADQHQVSAEFLAQKNCARRAEQPAVTARSIGRNWTQSPS